MTENTKNTTNTPAASWSHEQQHREDAAAKARKRAPLTTPVSAHHAADEATAKAHEAASDAYGASLGGASDEQQATYDAKAAVAWAEAAWEHSEATKRAYEDGEEEQAHRHVAAAYEAAANATHAAESSEGGAGDDAASTAREHARQAAANSEGAW